MDVERYIYRRDNAINSLSFIIAKKGLFFYLIQLSKLINFKFKKEQIFVKRVLFVLLLTFLSLLS